MTCQGTETCGLHDNLSGTIREMTARQEAIFERIDEFRGLVTEFRDEFRALSKSSITVEAESRQLNKEMLSIVQKLTNNEERQIRLEERWIRLEAENKKTNETVLELVSKLSDNEARQIRLEGNIIRIEAESMAREQSATRRVAYLAIIATLIAAVISVFPSLHH